VIASTEGRIARWKRDGLSFLGDVLRLPDGSSYGGSLDDWQRADFGAAFSTDKNIWWERPRGHSKTMDSAAFGLHHLLSAPGRRAFIAAVDRDQAGLAHDSLRGFIQRSDLLRSALKVDRFKVTAPSTDSTLEVLAADAASSWGLRPSLVVVDEFSQWRGDPAEEFFHALFSSLGKVAGARMLIATTSGWDKTSLAWKMREQMRDDPAWVFSRIGQMASWVSPEFLEQQRRILPAHVFARLHENLWTESGGAYLSFAEVSDIFSASLSPVLDCKRGEHFVGVDIGLSGDATAVSVLHAGKDGEIAIHDIRTWRGTRADKVRLSDVEVWIRDAVKRFSGCTVFADPWQAVGMVQRLSERGVRCRESTFTQSYRAHIFSNLLELVRARRLRCFPHGVLKDELLRLEFKEVSGNLRVDHPSGGHDDHVVATAMAALAAVQAGRPGDILRVVSIDGDDDEGDLIRQAASRAKMMGEDPAAAQRREAERQEQLATEREETAREQRIQQRVEALRGAGADLFTNG
jgi:hypothetical protein